jgi:anti-anti-sigma regulatory factor
MGYDGALHRDGSSDGMPGATMTAGADELRVSFDGELDVASSRLVGLLGTLVPTGGRSRVTIDLADVTFIDLRGVRAVARLVARYAAAGIRTRLIPPGHPCPAIISRILVEAATDRGAVVSSRVRPAPG